MQPSEKCRLINISGNKGVPISNTLPLSEPSVVVGWVHTLLRTLFPWFVGQYDLWKLMRLMGSL